MKTVSPVSVYLKIARDILTAFLLCAGMLCIISTGRNKSEFLTFHDAPIYTGTETSKPSDPPQKEVFHMRTFDWIDPTKASRHTTFNIPEKALNDEIKRFGRPRAMIMNPLYLKKRGFRVIGRRDYIRDRQILERIFTMVDYKQIFDRNQKYFSPLTAVLLESAELPRGTDPLHTLLSFVQYVEYREPPQVYKGKFIGSFFVPLVCLYEKYADCDSKSLLLAEFLVTVPDSSEKVGIILVRGNGLSHALLGVRMGRGRKYMPGMTALFFAKKGYYIVLETTRPKWAPGFIERRVTDALKSGMFQFVEFN
jgi:hypothetical protein